MRCEVCGRAAFRRDTHRNCRPGLGDRVASALSAVGITKDRVSALVGGDCGCQERQEWLNRVGRQLGIGAPPAPDFHDQRLPEQSEP